MNEYWKELINKYADGRPICNCGNAYYSTDGDYVTVGGTRHKDGKYCKYGCDANQYIAREEIAKKLLTNGEWKK